MDDSLFLFLALAFLGAMLFYSSRKRKKAAQTLQSQSVKGAYVMLTSGIYGKITAVAEDRVEIETAPGQRMFVAIGAVRSIEQEPKAPKVSSKPSAKTAPESTVKSAAESATKPAPKTAAKTTPKTTPKKK